MRIRKTNWKHFTLGYPILFALAYALVYLIKCVFFD